MDSIKNYEACKKQENLNHNEEKNQSKDDTLQKKRLVNLKTQQETISEVKHREKSDLKQKKEIKTTEHQKDVRSY